MAAKTKQFNISGMHCPSCERIIESAIKKHKGVDKISVSYANERASITYDPQVITEEQLFKTIAELGYSVQEAKDKKTDSKHEHKDAYSMRSMMYRLIVSGICAIILMVGSMVPFAPGFLKNQWVMLVLASIVQFWAARSFYMSAWMALKQRMMNMDTLIVLGTSVAYVYSVIQVILQSFYDGSLGHIYFETSASIITLVLLGAVLEKRARQQTSKAISTLLRLQAKQAMVKKNGSWVEVPLEQVVVGDVLLIKPGDTIPVDGEIVSGESSVDESLVTGESMPVAKKMGDRVIGSTTSETGSFEMKATQVGSETVLSKIVERVRRAQGSKAPVEKMVDKVAAVFIPLVIVASIIAFILWFWLGPEPRFVHAITSLVAVLIIACPCAMGIAAPMSIMVSMGRGAKEGILIKDAETLERAGSVTTMILDKTGTLTEGKQKVAHFETIENLNSIAQQQGWKIASGKDATLYVTSLLVSVEALSNHPVSKAVVQYFKDKTQIFDVGKVETLPGLGIRATVEGKEVLVGAERLFVRENITLSPKLLQCAREWSEKAQTSSYMSIDGTSVAAFCLSDAVRSGAKEIIAALKKSGITPIMLTGDNEKTAHAVAKQVGIEEVLAQVMPDEKEETVRKLKKKGEVVAMVGDGINDAPALAAADIGIAMSGGTDVAIETAGISLLRSDITLLPKVVNLSKTTVRNIIQNLVWAFGYNIILIPVAMGILYPWWGITLNPIFAGAAMAFSSISVVLNALRLNKVKIS